MNAKKWIITVIVIFIALIFMHRPASWVASLAGWGETTEEKPDYMRAQLYLRTAMVLNPDYGWPHKVMGDIKIRTSDISGAFRSYSRAIELNPECKDKYVDCSDAYWHRGYIYRDFGETELARKDIRMAKKLSKAGK